MSKVFLLNPPYPREHLIRSGRWVRTSYAKQSWYPVWLSYGTAVLEREGYDCMEVDSPVDESSHLETTDRAKAFRPDLVVSYWSYDTWKNDLNYADHLASCLQREIVLVGPWSHVMPDALEKTRHVNMMTNGEFEHTLIEIAEGKEPADIKGLTWREPNDGGSVINEGRPLVQQQELDRIPFVTDVYNRHLNIHAYRQSAFRLPFVDLLTARGCPWAHGCTFCVWPRAFQGGPSYRWRSMKNVIKEFRFIDEELPFVKQVHLQNDTLPEAYATKLANAILDSGLELTWSGYARAELSYDCLKLMKDSGLQSLHVGYESGSQKMLDAIQKHEKVTRMEAFAKDIKKLDIWTCAGFIIGNPGETEETIRETVEFAKRIQPHRFSLSVLKRYPNLPVYEDAASTVPLKVLEEREEWAFSQFYMHNPKWMFKQMMNFREWKNLAIDAFHLIKRLTVGGDETTQARSSVG